MSEGQQRKIIHIDCDSFFASVEMRDDPSLRGRPVAVGGSPDGRGVVATCSYEARRFGVRSAMPMAQALRLCPELVVLRTRMDKYKDASEAVHSIFRRFTDRIEPLSLDEAFLDVTGSVLFNGSATRIAEAIRRAVREELGLTVSAGVAPNKFLAKIASDWRKPDGLFVLKPDEVDAFVRRLPVEKLFGVGPRTAEKLHRLGLRSCEDLRALDLPTLTERFGVFGQRLFDLARGKDERPVQPHRVRKSLSVERTFSEDLATEAACLALFPELLSALETRLGRQTLEEAPSRGFVKVRFDDFTTTTAEAPMVGLDREGLTTLLRTAWARGARPVRLLGVGLGFRSQRMPQRQLPLPYGAAGAELERR